VVLDIIEKKHIKIILLAYLILALIGSSAISAGEAFYIEYSNNDSLSSGRCFSSINHTIDWLAGVTIRKANGYPNSMSRSRLLRVFALAGIIVTVICPVKTDLKLIKNKNTPILKNLILLKLRI